MREMASNLKEVIWNGRILLNSSMRASWRLEGKHADALAMFKGLERKLNSRGYNGRIADHVAIKRLSR